MKHQRIRLFFLAACIWLLNNATMLAQEPRRFQPLPEALIALTSDAEVTVTEVVVPEWEAGSDFYIAFEPTAVGAPVGCIIYPGAYVDPRSYAPLAHEIARQGFPAFIVKMVNDLAIGESVRRASRVISDHPGIAIWAIGGHSMGAFGGCVYAREHADAIAGVVLWAGYPSALGRLDDREIKAVSIYGTYDGICTLDEIEYSRQHLPADTQFIALEGGNHTQFGWYDTSPDPVQPGDNLAGITRQAQQDEIVRATVDFLDSLAANTCPLELLYGTHSKEARALRQLRDNFLSKTAGGKEISALYYGFGPYIARVMKEDKALRAEVKKLVDGMLAALRGEAH